MKRSSGFTLLELMIVIVLSLMILGLVSLYFPNFLSSTKLQATVREFSTTLRQARNLAKISGEPKGVTIDLDARQYGLEGGKIRKIPPNLEVKVFDSTAGEITNGQYRLVFDPNGGGEGATFQITNGKKAFKIWLDPLMGGVVTSQ